MVELPAPRVALWRSAAFRLAALQAVIFAAILVSLFGVVWWSVGNYVEQRVHASAEDKLRVLTQMLENRPGNELEVDALELGTGEHFGLFDADGRHLDGEIREMPPHAGDVRVHILSRGPLPRLLHVVEQRVADGQRLFVGYDRSRADALLVQLRRAFLAAVVTGVTAALLAGFITARRYLRRVEQIATVAAQIAEGQIETRLPVSGRRDEIDQLSAALNSTWQRSEQLLEGMRQLSSDIAHELRTPLAHLRFRLEQSRASIEARNPARAVMDRSIADVDHVLSVFGALLRIAQIQSRQRRAGFGPVDLSQLVGGVVADYRPLFEDEGRSLAADIEPGIATVGDRPLLVQLLVNLIENVLRHTPKGVPLTVRLLRAEDAAKLIVEDAGPGIPATQHERVLQRFVRLEASRATQGTGLGLALVKAISDLHEARLRLDELNPGLRVTISLPLAR
jgi:signal transduction histidine kinase